MIDEFTQASHGFVVGDIVRFDGTTWYKAQADSAEHAEVQGVVRTIVDSNTFKLVYDGLIEGLSGLTPGQVYFLSATTAGAATTTEPSNFGEVSKPVYFALTTTSANVLTFRGVIIEPQNGTSGTSGTSGDPVISSTLAYYNNSTQSISSSSNTKVNWSTADTANTQGSIGLTFNGTDRFTNTSAIVGRGIIDSITPAGTGNTLVISSARGTFPIGERLEVSTNSSVSANVAEVNLTVGVYEIKKFINTLKYSSANNDKILESSRIYRYDADNKKVAEGLLLTVSHDSGSNTGNLTFIPLKGYFTETDRFYTDTNTSIATTVTYTVSNAGGDYVASEHARLLTQTTNTSAIPLSTSFGSGAQFNVGTLGDTEDIFIGTDIISANGVGTLDYDRVTLTVGSNAGFVVGDRVYQEISKIGFNANSSVNATSGFIDLPTANTRFTIGDIVKYQVDAGNTALTGLYNGDYYYIALANSTGVILSYPYRKSDQINSTNFSTFANNKVNEEGHYLYKLTHGTVFEIGSGVLRTKDNHNYFSNTGGTANTTAYANSNVTKHNATTNTAISAVTVYTTLTQANQAYAALPVAAAALGFPKNPQGDSKNTIFSCLSFNKFTIGTIGSLSGVDPGSGYNVDPYVLAHQPYISAFDRKDFIINISDATGVFAVGEKVNQTFANLVYYDLKVDDGAYSNTFDEKAVTINVDDEIQSGNDFILYVSNNTTFNTTDQVNSNTDS